jgi:hypothetical protein
MMKRLIPYIGNALAQFTKRRRDDGLTAVDGLPPEKVILPEVWLIGRRRTEDGQEEAHGRAQMASPYPGHS